MFPSLQPPVPTKNLRAIDLLTLFPPALTPAEKRPTISLPRRKRAGAPVDIDLTKTDDATATKPTAEILELSDDSSDFDMEGPFPRRTTRTDYIYNSNDLIATRQTVRSWKGSYRPDEWVISREELHADEVDRARALAIDLEEADYPKFVRLFL
jgi:hypothetical protein